MKNYIKLILFTIVGLAGFLAMSFSKVEAASPPYSILLLCATSGCTHASYDVPVKNYMSSTLGHTVTTALDTEISTSSYDVVVISESVNSGNTNWIKDDAVAILTLEGATWDELDLGTGGGATGTSDTDWNILNNSHYATSEQSTGNLTVSSATTENGYISGWSNDVIALAVSANSGTQGRILVIENGGTLVDSTTAAERRAYFAARDFSPLNSTGEGIFTRLLDWSAYNALGPTTLTTQSHGGYSSNYFYGRGTIDPGSVSNLNAYIKYGFSNVACSSLPFNALYGGIVANSGSLLYSKYISASPNTTYYYCAAAWNSTDSSWYYASTTYSLTTSATSPSISSPTKTSITSSGATLGANVTSTGGLSITGRGVCVGASSNPSLGGTCFSTSGTTGVFTVGATGLDPNTLYHYRAYATNTSWTSYTTDSTFTTLAGIPTVTTPTQSGRTSSGATLGANVTSDGGANITARGTCWGTSASPTGNCSTVSGTTGVFTGPSAATMTSDTFIYYRGYAVNSAGTGYSVDDTFTTLAGPTVTTLAPDSVLQQSANLKATADPNGNASIGWFRYYTSDPSTCSDSGGVRLPASSGTPFGPAGSNIPYNQGTGNNLTPGIPYWSCAFASNVNGPGAGNPVSFQAGSGVPTNGTTSTQEGLNSWYVTLKGSVNPNGFQTGGFFRVWTSNPGSCSDDIEADRYPTNDVNDKDLGSGTSSVPFQLKLGFDFDALKLAPGVDYWYCALGVSEYGTVLGSTVVPFTTDTGANGPCDPPLGGNHTVLVSCSYSGSIGGVDAGPGTSQTGVLAIDAGKALTIDVAQEIAWGSISLGSGSRINLAPGSALRRKAVWITDSDGDGVVSAGAVLSSTQPAGGVRRNTLSSTYTHSHYLAEADLDCNDNNGYIFQNVDDLVFDADNDGYKTSAGAGTQCVGIANVINGRTYYNGGSGPN